ncbi:hypothetical protein BKA64DRAFT_119842 [Cadophora sp. MPI-SDFR-AT-0126]|nr:hypothetical protein BKA64DRAFT_119842 [Leotiomycetes sp. MPI-SDFR-AT-0126]
MAEAFAIVGATAAILQFSEFAGKVIYTACDLYSSVSGHTQINEGVEKVTLTLKDLLGSLRAQHGSSSQAGQNEHFTSLIDRCRYLGDKLLVILEKTQKRKGQSVRDSLKAGWMTVWKESEMDDLRRELESCVNQLGLHLIAIFRSETGQKLERLLAENLSQKSEIVLLHQALARIELDQKLAVESLGGLREIFSHSDLVSQRKNQNRILESLAFEGMGHRYQDISRSATDTFNWILQDLEIPKSHPDLKISFREWLVRGEGVFHISGKPGAGKSTLMKFIVEHDDTRKYLEEWAGNNTLVVANFFVWKPGTRLQKSLDGLIRSILHSILKGVPELMPIALPDYWNQIVEFRGQQMTELDISFRKAFEALSKVIGNMELATGHSFCFFIDGLDEFDDPNEHHTKLVKRLQSWTSRNSRSVKICVSSREENTFMNNLLIGQRLRLHLLTEDDIRKSVEESLGHYDKFVANSVEDRHRFVDAIVRKAEGVFLWIRLVLHRLGEVLETSGNLKNLHDDLRHIPKELEDLFSTLLASIDRSDQDEACAFLAILMWAEESKYQFMRIFDYYFVKDFLKDERFAEAKEILPLSTLDIISRKEETMLHLNRLLKGIVELEDHDNRYGEGSLTDAECLSRYGVSREDSSRVSFLGRVRVTHRSIYDFLKTDCPSEMRKCIKSMDVRSILLQCAMAHVKSIKLDRFAQESLTYGVIRVCLTRFRESCSENHLEQLAIFDDLLIKMQCCDNLTDGFDIPGVEEGSLVLQAGGIHRRIIRLSVLARSFVLANSEYVAWTRKHRAPLFALARTRAQLLQCLFYPIISESQSISRAN